MLGCLYHRLGVLSRIRACFLGIASTDEAARRVVEVWQLIFSWSLNKRDVLGSRATSQCQHVKGHPSRSHGSITWSTIFSDSVHRLIIGTIAMFEEERVEFLMSKLVRVVLDARLSPRDPRRSGEAVSLPVDWCAWENKPTRDSWEHVGAPERALRGGSCFPRTPGSLRLGQFT